MYDHPGIRINRAAMAIVNGITHIILKLILSHINLMFPHHRPINSNNNSCAVFLLPCLRKRIDWFHLTTNLSTNIVDIFNFTHVTHHCLHAAAGDPLPSFCKVGWRKLWRKSDVSSMLQGTYSPFLYRDYSLNH